MESVVTFEAVTEAELCVQVGERIYKIPFSDYPMLRGVPEAILRDIHASPTTLRWPELDVDIALEALDHPALCANMKRDTPAL